MTGIGAAMAGGNPRLGRADGEYYPTPTDVTRALLAAWRPTSPVVWEPACGCGAMARELYDAGCDVISSDLHDRGCGDVGVDFLKEKKKRSDCIITNPPFNLAAKFIAHAHDLGISEIALVLKSTYWHASTRRALWERRPPRLILPLLWRPDFLNRGSPTMDIMWCVWSADPGPTEYRPLSRPASSIVQ